MPMMEALKNVMLNETTKKCSKCGVDKPLNNIFFAKNSHSITGFRSDCKDCSNKGAKEWRDNNKDKIREARQKRRAHDSEYKKQYHQNNKEEVNKKHREYYEQKIIDVPLYNKKRALKIRFNLSLEEYNKMLANQNGRCLICGTNELTDKSIKYFIIDHNHKSGNIRGLLCRKCNSFLGFVNDNTLILVRAIKYLRGEL